MSFFELIKSIEFSFKDNTGSINKYVDTFLTRFKMQQRLLTKKDSYRIPNKKKYSFDSFISIYGFIVYGLCSVNRESDCKFSFLQDDTIKVDTILSVRDVCLLTKFEFSSLFVLRGDIEATLNRLYLKIILIVTERGIEVKSVHLIKIGHYEIKTISGINNSVAWIAKMCINASDDPLMKRKMINTIEHICVESVANIISSYTVPILVLFFVRIYKCRRYLLIQFLLIFPLLLIYFYSLLFSYGYYGY